MAALEKYMDNIPIRRKFMQLYIVCVLVPLIITDSVVLYIVGGMERERERHEMANIANSVSYNINSMVDNAGEIAKSIYTNKSVNSFLEKEYDSSSEYYGAYRDFFQNTILENVLGMNQITFTMYTDNDTVIRGGKIDNMTSLKKTKAYEDRTGWKEAKTKAFFSLMRGVVMQTLTSAGSCFCRILISSNLSMSRC